MKKLILAIFALVLASCTKEQFSESRVVLPGQEITLTATRGDPETRTERASDGAVLWSPGDQISLFYGSGTDGGSCFTAQNAETAKVANFTGTIGVITGGNDVSVEDTYFWATYPYNATASCDGTSVTTVLPSEQVATPDTFVDDLFPSIGRSQGLNMAFYNICGGLKFTVSEEGIKSVTLKGNNGEQLAGRINVGLDEKGLPFLRGIEKAEESITVSAPNGESLLPGKSYYIILIPTVFDNGFSLTFVKDGFKAVKNRTAKTTIRRSVFGSLTTPDAGLAWEEVLDSQTVPPDNEVWYTTYDGRIIELNNENPFDATIVSHTYENGKGIICCDAPITEVVNYAFADERYKVINSIFLPNSVIYLRNRALYGTNIKEFHLPDALKYVGDYALNIDSLEKFSGNNVSEDGRCVIFAECLESHYGNQYNGGGYLAAFARAGLTSYELPSETETVYGSAFDSCSDLREIIFNEGLKVIDSGFKYDSFDCDIYLPSTLEGIGSDLFTCTKGIRGFYGNENFHTADHMCLTTPYGDLISFAGESLEEYIIPEGIESIGLNAFYQLPALRTLTFPSSLKSVHQSAFYDCPNLEMVYGDCTSEDHKGIVFGNKYQLLLAKKGVIEYEVPEGIQSIGYEAFSQSQELETIILPDTVKELGGYAFSCCPKLKKVVLSSNLETVDRYNPFLRSYNLEEIYFRSYFPPKYSDTQFWAGDCERLTVYVPEESLDLYKQSGWSQYAPYMVGYKCDAILPSLEHILYSAESWGPECWRLFPFDRFTDDWNQRTQLYDYVNGSITSATSWINTLWAGLYNGITAANEILRQVMDDDGLSALERTEYIGEAKFCRASFYMYLIAMWGDVPFFDESGSYSTSITAGRVSKQIILQKVYADFDDATELLPLYAQSGRLATKGAALAMKARAALLMSDWVTCASASNACMDLGVYSLHPDYRELFLSRTKTSQEQIFALPCSNELRVYAYGGANTRSFIPRNNGGTAVCQPSWDLFFAYPCTDGLSVADSPLYDAAYPFKNRDPRLSELTVPFGEVFMDYVYNPRYSANTTLKVSTGEQVRNNDSRRVSKDCSYNGLVLKKFIDEEWTDDRLTDEPMRIIRYADVLLMYAEAKIELGQIDVSVYTALNSIRARAYKCDIGEVDEYPTVSETDQGKLRRIIRNERRCELAWENRRWFDLIRWRILESLSGSAVYGLPSSAMMQENEGSGCWIWPKDFRPAMRDDSTVDISGIEAYSYYYSRNSYRPYEEKVYLLPIPDTAIALNNSIGQNPGY